MNSYAKRQVVECLRELANTSFQERVWVRGEGPEVSSYTDVVCQLFDDTGLGDLLESGMGSEVLGYDAERALMHLADLTTQLDSGLDAASLLQHPVWNAIVEAAGMAADLVAEG